MKRPHPASHLRSLGCALFAALQFVPATAPGQALPYLFESAAGSGPPNKIVWQTEPGGATPGSARVIRGGCWRVSGAFHSRCAARIAYWPYYACYIIGFRPARGQP